MTVKLRILMGVKKFTSVDFSNYLTNGIQKYYFVGHIRKKIILS
jgi:hypothetical protein